MPKTLLTGFTPFAGRELNASWLAVSLLKEKLQSAKVNALEIPVVWGMPEKLLSKAIKEQNPELVIAMGEGKRGCFHLESLAGNQRQQKQDNNDSFPTQPLILASGQAFMPSSAPLLAIRNKMLKRGIPALISLNAGGFLCEETLYCLERIKQQSESLTNVVFVHLPPYGTALKFKGKPRLCDEGLLLEFSLDFYNIVA